MSLAEIPAGGSSLMPWGVPDSQHHELLSGRVKKVSSKERGDPLNSTLARELILVNISGLACEWPVVDGVSLSFARSYEILLPASITR
jgi:hypothetical protein